MSIFSFSSPKKPKSKLICTRCGSLEVSKVIVGNTFAQFLTFVFLLLLGILPGIIYFLSINGEKLETICKTCGGKNCIPVDSPIGKKLINT